MKNLWTTSWAVGAAALLALTACGGTAEDAGAPAESSAAQTESPDSGGGGYGGGESPAAAAAALTTAGSPVGAIVVDSKGMAVYYFDQDVPNSGESTCTGDCLVAWPPVLVDSETPKLDGVTGETGTIETPDGELQATVNGLPIYYFVEDKKAGDIKGQAVGDVWWLIAPNGDKITDTASTSTNAAALTTAGSPVGDIVVDSKGMAVYYFDQDVPNSGESTCTGDCLVAWPPVLVDSETPEVDGVTGETGTIETPDGELQATVNGLPIYYFVEDKKAGDIKGQAVGDVWWLVAPNGDKITDIP
ncbi:hypothetical protein [Arthrobacter pigmenti]